MKKGFSLIGIHTCNNKTMKIEITGLEQEELYAANLIYKFCKLLLNINFKKFRTSIITKVKNKTKRS